jgi:hypothetical protein
MPLWIIAALRITLARLLEPPNGIDMCDPALPDRTAPALGAGFSFSAKL